VTRLLANDPRELHKRKLAGVEGCSQLASLAVHGASVAVASEGHCRKNREKVFDASDSVAAGDARRSDQLP
jgi:hypothetical protein